MSKQSETFERESKKPWYSTTGSLSNEQLTLGCLQRIAKSLEQMADNNFRVNNMKYSVERLEKSNARYKKIVKDLKKEVKN